MTSKGIIPKPTVRRLPRYYFFLKSLSAKGHVSVSSFEIADELGLEDTLVRKDLSATGFSGKPKVGYSVSSLQNHIENILGLNNAKDAVIVGIGNLGRALMAYPGFTEFGLTIVAAFDADPSKVGTRIRDVVIESTDSLVERLAVLRAHIGIITVPGEAAQDVCDRLVEGGVIAVWNFAPVHLALPEHVIIQNENLAARLSHLSHQVVSLVYAK
ncbi:MAG: redox-sensing transcriptional repressor Rex [Candidatus Brocadiia bacterium]